MNAARQPAASRRERAAARVQTAWDELRHCTLCAWRCGVDRQAGERGPCLAGPSPHWFAAQVESGEEAELCPCFTISLSGCDLRCAFCVTGRESWNPRAGQVFEARSLAEKARQALSAGARTIQILGGEPTLHLPAVLEFVALLPEKAHLVWKTNGHGGAAARRLLEGLFDTWLVDFKFGNDACGRRLAGVPHYLAAVGANLRWAHRRTHLIVRHLLMPGHLECCWKPVAAWLARELPGVKVSLRTGFWPAWRSGSHPELRTGVAKEEVAAAWQVAAEHGLRLVPSGIDFGFTDSQEEFRPAKSPAPRAEMPATMVPGGGEILLLPDGRVLSHNTTPALAGLMRTLRTAGKDIYEFPRGH